MLHLVVDHVYTEIYGLKKASYAANRLDSVTSYKIPNAWFSTAYKKGHWDGIKRFREWDPAKQIYRIPTGFLERLCQVWDESGVEYDVLDERVLESPEPVYRFADGIDIREGKYDYQAGVLDEALLQGRGIIAAPTGAGKTRIAASLSASFHDKNVLVLTHRRILANQLRETHEKALGEPVGLVGDGECTIGRVTIGMVQSLSKWIHEPELENLLLNTEVAIGDEVHHVANAGNQWDSLFKYIPAPYRYGLSATPILVGPGLNLVAMCGETIVKIEVEDLIERGVLVEPYCWVASPPKPDLKHNLKGPAAYREGIVENAARNNLIVQIGQILKSDGRKPISLVKQKKHGKILVDLFAKAGVRATYIHGSTTQSQREEYLEDLRRGSLDHVVATQEVMGEGVDIPWLDTILNATGTGAGGALTATEEGVGRTTIQALGRALRAYPEKTRCDYIDFYDEGVKRLEKNSKERREAIASVVGEKRIYSWSSYFQDG